MAVVDLIQLRMSILVPSFTFVEEKHFAMLGFDSSTNDRNLKNQLFV